jgi:hypothetical protein
MRISIFKNKLLSLSLLLTVSTFFSCSKNDQARKKIAGNYSFYHYEVDYYNADGIKIDSTKQWDFDGTLDLKNDNSAGSDWYNECDYSLSDYPKGWVDNVVNSHHPYWHTDQGSMKTISFFVEPNPGNVRYATYTITKNGHRKYIFSYVSANSSTGKIIYEERLYLKEK